MSSSMDPGPKLRLLTNVLLLSDRSGRSRTLSPSLPPFRPRQAVGLVGILVSRSRELEIAVGTVFGFDDRLDRLLRTLCTVKDRAVQSHIGSSECRARARDGAARIAFYPFVCPSGAVSQLWDHRQSSA